MRHLLRSIVGFSIVLLAAPASSQLIFPDGSSMDSSVYSRNVVVKANGTDAENGTALLSALSGITDAAANNRYLIQLEAGTYDLGSSTIYMKPFVDLQGAGMNSTTVTSTNRTTIVVDSALYPEFSSTARAGISNLEVDNSFSGSNDSSDCVQVHGGAADLYRVLLSLTSAAQFGPRGITLYSPTVPCDVSLGNCSIVGSVGTSRRTGIFVAGGGPNKLNLNLVHVDVSAGTSANIGIWIYRTTSVATIRYTDVDAGQAASNSIALLMGPGAADPFVDTFHSFFRGDFAFKGFSGSSSHSGTGFHGVRTGFTDGVDAFFSNCYDFTTGVTIPITDSSVSVAP